jgi:hypothetical protein
MVAAIAVLSIALAEQLQRLGGTYTGEELALEFRVKLFRRLVRAFGQEGREQARFVSSSGQDMRARIGVRRVQAGAISLGELVLVMSYLARFYLPFQEIGYQTIVGERGMRLSGGSASASRWHVPSSSVPRTSSWMSPTSSVDLATEVCDHGGVERLMCGRTTLMIAYRLSTLSRFDLRPVMESGRSSTLIAPASSGGEWVAQPAS